MKTLLLSAMATLMCLLTLSVNADTWHVSPEGDDAAAGTSADTAWGSLKHAFARLKPGDTLILGPGRYHVDEILVIQNKASSREEPITILAQPRGEAIVSAAWPTALSGDLTWEPMGDGVYRSSIPGPKTGGRAFYGDHFLPFLADVEQLKNNSITLEKGDGGFKAGETVKLPGPAVSQDEQNHIYIRLPDNRDPNGESVLISGRLGPGDYTPSTERDGDPYTAVMTIRNAPAVIIDGLTFEGGGRVVAFDRGSDFGVVRNCIMRGTGGVNTRSDDLIIEWCEIYTPGLMAFSRALHASSGKKNTVWPLSKVTPTGTASDLVRSDLETTDEQDLAERITVRFNYMHEVWDGEKIGTTQDSNVHHNIYENCFDNATELEGLIHNHQRVRNIRWHHNLVIGRGNGIIGMQDQTPRPSLGPVYLYRNVFRYDNNGPDWNECQLLMSMPTSVPAMRLAYLPSGVM